MNFPEILNSFYSGVIGTSVFEWIAFFTALVYVVLAAYESTWCWMFALISTVFYFYVCLISNLYLETFLQVFYFLMGIYGWMQWNNKATENEVSHVVSWSFRKNLPLILLGIVVFPPIGFLFYRYTNASQPWLDAAITTFSFIATWMVAKKILENWIFWIVIDFAAVFLYANKMLMLTSFLYFIYTILAAYGYFKWKKLKPVEVKI